MYNERIDLKEWLIEKKFLLSTQDIKILRKYKFLWVHDGNMILL